ncbi:MAG: hypothetical protein QOJ65_1575 [Fimbriimonadaceae bacterium]|jgi:hypothetical protein|nr:hypothetical protein [Fimbriimonadaceae bacterium]
MRSRISLILLLFCAFAATWADDLTKKIDYTTIAVPLQRAMADISKQAGVGLFVQPELQDEIVVLRLKGVTTDEAMKKIAAVVGAEWRKAKDGYELSRSPDMATKLYDDAIAARAASLRSSVAAKLKQTQADQPMTPDRINRIAAQLAKSQGEHDTEIATLNYRELANLQQSVPDSRALWQMVAKLDPKLLARIELGQRVVVSNKPNSLQTEVSDDIASLGEQLFQDHNAFADAFLKFKKPKQGQTDEESPAGGPGDKMPAVPVRFTISLERQFFGDSISAQMLGFDADNNPVVFASGNLEFMGDFGNVMADRAKLVRAAESEPALTISPRSQAMLDFMKKAISGGGGSMQPATGELREFFLHPEETDPLGTLASEALIGMAEQRGANLVAYPDDTLFLVAMFAGQEGKLKPTLIIQALTGLGPISQMSLTEADGWMTVAPDDRYQAYISRTNRAALGQYLRAFNENGFAPIAATAKLAESARGREFGVLSIFVPMMLSQEAVPQGRGNVNILKLYASLGQEQIDRLDGGQSIRFAELDKSQISLLRRYVYQSAESRYDVVSEGSKTSYLQQQASQEPTESMPNGLPADGMLSLDVKKSTTYFVKVKADSFEYTSPMDINSLAWTISLKDHPEQSPGYHPKVESIAPGEDRTLTFKLQLDPKRIVSAQLRESRKSGAGPYTLDNLPEDIKKELDKAIAQYKNMRRPDNGAVIAPKATPPPR